MSKWHPFYRMGVHMVSLSLIMMLFGTLFLWFLLSNKASAAEPDPKCWVCSFKPPEKSEAPPALVIKPQHRLSQISFRRIRLLAPYSI